MHNFNARVRLQFDFRTSQKVKSVSKLSFYTDVNPCHQKKTTKQNISVAREKDENVGIAK